MKLEAALPRLLLVAGLVAAATLLAVNRDSLDVAAIEQLTRDLGVWAPVGHVVLFAAGTVLFAPGVIFGLVGGALFGPFMGTLLNLAGVILGATAAFLVARYVAADWVRARSGARIERLISGVEAEGWRFVALMRLVPRCQSFQRVGNAKDLLNFSGMVAANAISGDMPLLHWDSATKGFLLDVREPLETGAERGPEALDIPVRQPRARLGELPRDREIHVFRRSGERSYIATLLHHPPSPAARSPQLLGTPALALEGWLGRNR